MDDKTPAKRAGWARAEGGRGAMQDDASCESHPPEGMARSPPGQ